MIFIYKCYLLVIKFGIIMGNVILVMGGFLFVFCGDIDYWLLFVMFIGLLLVVVLGCVINNCID